MVSKISAKSAAIGIDGLIIPDLPVCMQMNTKILKNIA
jgi:tryptophan synthase alpha subunit